MTRPRPDRAREDLVARTELAAAFLAGGRTLDAWSRALAVASLLGLFWPTLPAAARGWLALSVALALLQAWWAWRVALDARIFAGWASIWATPAADRAAAGDADSSAAMADTLRRFDRALGHWRPRGAPARAASADVPRPLTDRLHGARKLLGKQALSLFAQTLCVTGAIAAAWPT